MVAIRSILLPTDFTPLARHAADYVRLLAESHKAAVHVVHVNEPVFTGVPATEIGVGVVALPVDEQASREQLDRFVAESFPSPTFPIQAALLSGSASAAITEYAETRHVDLIVIGTHARGLMNRILLGSVSKSVLEHARCAVLMVPLRSVSGDTSTTP